MVLRAGLPRFFFFNDTATTEIYTLSLHDALPISGWASTSRPGSSRFSPTATRAPTVMPERSEEHTSELQSHLNLVCRLLLEKKNSNPPAMERLGPDAMIPPIERLSVLPRTPPDRP